MNVTNASSVKTFTKQYYLDIVTQNNRGPIYWKLKFNEYEDEDESDLLYLNMNDPRIAFNG
jgi:hypothetical protein